MHPSAEAPFASRMRHWAYASPNPCPLGFKVSGVIGLRVRVAGENSGSGLRVGFGGVRIRCGFWGFRVEGFGFGEVGLDPATQDQGLWL